MRPLQNRSLFNDVHHECHGGRHGVSVGGKVRSYLDRLHERGAAMTHAAPVGFAAEVRNNNRRRGWRDESEMKERGEDTENLSVIRFWLFFRLAH